ncbi:MAG: methyltransferase domain-containing protein [Planctomycetales bacterium]|nr:methyltransferase domain-containing protein [Planctomycetales bacterium]
MKSSNTATEFHSQIRDKFVKGYQVKKDFKDRYKIWTGLIDRYVAAGSRVLDAGCGPGLLSFYCASKQCDVIGIDGSSAMIEYCLAESAAQGGGIEFLHRTFPLAANQDIGTFDTILCSSVIEYMDDPVEFLEDLDRRLRPGGMLLISVPNRRSVYKQLELLCFRVTRQPAYLSLSINTFAENELNGLLEPMGYKSIETIYYGSGKQPIGAMFNLFGQVRGKNMFVSALRKSGD